MRIIVTCAIIESNNKVLVVQRSGSMKLPLKWEFPGGKIENIETEEDCIKREIREELNLEIELVKKLTSSIFDYPEISIELIPFVAKQIGGQIKLNEHVDFKYLEKLELMNLDWAEADVPIVKEYLDL
ncbi:MAG: (deoxy)nucleoside triphosphate pyrophosphohydrolase [Chitinophagales bacterium]|nr:(deoxy)nucleoside triphosphate pyrophosphohydrolase [Chitinophagales bacterium]